jgi:prepilin-type N-terminal cleavage/methylation domain-containing protein
MWAMPCRTTPSGFTLTEVLLVTGIIGVLGTIVVGAVNPSKQLLATEDAKRSVAARELQQAMDQYLIKAGVMPGNMALLGTPAAAIPVCTAGVTADTGCLQLASALVSDYIIDLPIDRAEINPNYTGFGAYQIGGRPQIISYYLDTLAFNGSVDDYTHYWRLDQSTTSLSIYDSAGSNHGTITGNAQPATALPSALHFTSARSFQFDGNDDYIDVGTGVYSANLTVCAWVYSTAWNSNSNYQDTIVRAGMGDSASNFVLDFHGVPSGGNKALRFGVQGQATLVSIAAGATGIDLNEWHHVCATHNGTTASLYIDGALGASAAASAYPVGSDNSDHLYLGGRAGENEDSFTGYIDDIRIYDRALSAAEIQQIATGY